MIWIDETYINYLPDATSLEPLCGTLPELVRVQEHELLRLPFRFEGFSAVSQKMQTLCWGIILLLGGESSSWTFLQRFAFIFTKTRRTIPNNTNEFTNKEAQCSTRSRRSASVCSQVLPITFSPTRRRIRAIRRFNSLKLAEPKGCSYGRHKTWVFLTKQRLRFASLISVQENEQMLAIIGSVLCHPIEGDWSSLKPQILRHV